MAQTPKPKAKTAPVTSRVIAGLYDLMIFIGIGMIAFIPISIVKSYTTLPHWVEVFFLCSVAYAYFAGFWVKGQATTGMCPWNLRVTVKDTGKPLSFPMATVRFLVFGTVWVCLAYVALCIRTANIAGWDFALAAVIPFISLLCMTFTRKHQALHDLFSDSCVYRVIH